MNDLERLVAAGVRTLSAQEVLSRIAKFIGQCVGLEGIIIVAREGQLGSFSCRPTPGLPDSRIKEAMSASLSRFEQVAQPNDPFETLIEIPGMRRLSFKETRERIGRFITSCQGVSLVLILLKNGDLANLRFIRSANISDDTAREIVRRALISFDQRGLPPPTA